MKKSLKYLTLLMSVLTTISLASCSPSTNTNDIEEDNIEYDDPITVDYNDMVSVSESTVEVTKVILHYHNDDGACGTDTTTQGSAGGRAFYLWTTGIGGVEYMPDSVSNNGQDMMITIDFTTSEFSKFYGKSKLMFIIKYRKTTTEANWDGQSSDTEILFEDYEADSSGTLELWTMPGSGSDVAIFLTEAETKVEGVKEATFTDWKTITCTNSASSVSYSLYAYDATYWKTAATSRDGVKKWYLIQSGTASGSTFTIELPYSAHIDIVYTIESLDLESSTGLKKTINVTFDQLYDDTRFETYYTYDGDDLGATYSSSQTTFKLWAPTSALVTLRIYGSEGTPADLGGSDSYRTYNMVYTGYGVWELTVSGMLLNYYYTYTVTNSSGTSEVVDPYAKACGVNGLRGMIYNSEYTNPDGWDDLPLVWDGVEGYDIETPQELTIYEVHVQDFTADESWNGTEENGTYNAFVESGTRLASDSTVTTGYDHLNELGVNAVQLQPVFDHDNDETDPDDYNWGYNPLNYNCVEGAYSSDPYNGTTRITEFKNMILQLSKTDSHTRVIMDVVYNHVSSASSSNFSKIMPKYYFRYNSDGTYANGSGCNNEIRTEATMVRKFIVDSVCWWATEYKIKGFRFDLMGLIDTETMKAVKEALYEIDPDIYVYGEGWTAGSYNGASGTTGSSTSEVYSMLYASTSSPGAVGAFNDAGRNALRGDNGPGWGYMQQGSGDATSSNAQTVAEMLWGIHSGKGGNPTQTVNYASCHDNYTLYDQLYYTLADGSVSPTTKVTLDASTAAHAAIFASNGVAFMLGGEEIFRTKEVPDELLDDVLSDTYATLNGHNISHNSYNSPVEVNSFKWDNKVSVNGVSTKSYFESFKEMVELHKTMTKFAYSDSGFPYSTTSAGNTIDNIYWAGSDKNNSTYYGACGFQVDEYFIFIGGRTWSYVSFGDVSKCTVLYSSGEYAYDSVYGTVNLGNYDNDTGGAIVVFKRG